MLNDGAVDWRDKYEYRVGVSLAPWGRTDHLRVWRRDHKDGIPWDDLQAIKNEVFGPEATAVEIYPPQAEVIDEVNMRHLWLVPEVAVPSLYNRR